MFLITLLIFSSAYAQVLPPRLPPYFNPHEFSVCLGESIAQSYNLRALHAKLNEIKDRRHELGTPTAKGCEDMVKAMCGLAKIPLPTQVQHWLAPLGCVVERQITESLLEHSTALTACDFTEEDKRKTNFYGSVEQWEFEHRDGQTNLNLVPDLNQQVEAVERHGGSQMAGVQTQGICLLRKADPLVRWLTQQSYRSVSHWQLFLKARELYGDPFTALAVIGELFDNERQVCSSRRLGCVLANRMKPLFAPGAPKYINPVGENYHFWAQLNVGLTEAAAKEKAAAYLLEWIKDGDSGEYSANVIGVDAGADAVSVARERATISAPVKPEPMCRLAP